MTGEGGAHQDVQTQWVIDAAGSEKLLKPTARESVPKPNPQVTAALAWRVRERDTEPSAHKCSLSPILSVMGCTVRLVNLMR